MDGASVFYTFNDIFALGAPDSSQEAVVARNAARLGLKVVIDADRFISWNSVRLHGTSRIGRFGGYRPPGRCLRYIGPGMTSGWLVIRQV
jgi:hypothetical protein